MWTSILAAASALLGILAKALGLVKTSQDEQAGIAMQGAADEKAAAGAQRRISDAEAQAIHSDSGVDKRLEDGTF
jgi:hypothetical protein